MELLNLHDDAQFPVDGRELHASLGIGTMYLKWIERMCEYGFVEGIDFRSKLTESTGGRRATNHDLTIGMAKELCMIQRTDIGRKVRQYLIEVEKAWNSPEQVYARALKMADETIKQLSHINLDLLNRNSELTVQNEIMAPKADYFDELVDRNLLTNFRETAKEFGVKERKFIQWLLDNKYIYRSKRGKLCPTANLNDGLFEIKECYNDKSKWVGNQTLVTPKGRETFRLLIKGASL